VYGVSRIVEAVQDNQVYLDHQLIDSLKLDADEVSGKVTRFMRATYPFMGLVLQKDEIVKGIPSRSMDSFILNGFNPGRAGDIAFSLLQNYVVAESGEEGTTHESSFDYDTHVPLVFFGWHIKAGESADEVFVEDIAPTITNLIHIQEPDATIGVPIIK
jgi:bisphosphoglycerate-independent phosphoglycerate mutase (AlkP superfamily)